MGNKVAIEYGAAAESVVHATQERINSHRITVIMALKANISTDSYDAIMRPTVNRFVFLVCFVRN